MTSNKLDLQASNLIELYLNPIIFYNTFHSASLFSIVFALTTTFVLAIIFVSLSFSKYFKVKKNKKKHFSEVLVFLQIAREIL